jgi:hypothetical protein
LRGALIEIDEISGRALRIMRIDEAGPNQALPEAEVKIDIEQAHSVEET